jgi:hypothetical protein
LTLNASPLERSKYNLCKQILIYLHRIYSWKDYHLSEKYCTDRLGISPTQVEYVLFCHIEKFTLDELVGYAEKLLPPFELVAIHQRSGKISNVSAPDDELPELFPKK